ncbi:MAG: hypothetical protein FJX57_11395, partial [Alphaproteobacteria bacterium]|nr:hypothetical protein [Alphaproteobacteria bacterium]
MKTAALLCATTLLSVVATTSLAQTTLVMPQLDEPRTLSPNFAADTGGYYPSSNIYSHLVVMDWGVVKGTP